MLLWNELPWAQTFDNFNDHLRLTIPTKEARKSRKKEWVLEHKKEAKKLSNNESCFLMYTDGSLSFDHGSCKTGFRYAAFHCSNVLLHGKGGTGPHVEVYDAKMEGLAQAAEHLTSWLDTHHLKMLPLHIAFYSDNTTALQHIFTTTPGITQNQSSHFRGCILKCQ
jgi:hypothetical protein